MIPLAAALVFASFSQSPAPQDPVQKVTDAQTSFNKTPGQQYTKWDGLDELAAAVRKDYRLPGLCIGYVQNGGQPEVGTAGQRNMHIKNSILEDDDRLLVGSIGEAMTATMIARLVELHKFTWTTTLAQALPGVEMQDDYKKITLEQLMRHKAWLPQAGQISQDELAKMAEKATTPKELRKAFVARLLTLPPADASTGQVQTHGLDYMLAGYAAERMLNQTYEWLMEKYLFTPMKISSVLIAPVASQGQVGSPGAVEPHILGDFGFQPYMVPMSNFDYVMAPAGAGVSCSMADLLKFASFHLRALEGDPQILTAESYKWLHTPPAGETEALGWTYAPQLGGEPCLQHSSNDGSFCDDITLWPTSKLAIVAITNAGTNRRPPPTMEAIFAIKTRLEQKQ